MAFDEKLAARVRKLLAGRPGLREQKMFGGICFMLRGNLCSGVLGDELIVRHLVDRVDELLAKPQVRKFDFTGRPMLGILMVGPGGTRTAAQLRFWVGVGLELVGTLPAKRKG